MKYSSVWFCAAVAASVLVLGSRTSHAQAVWRCDGGVACDDVVINDIEDITAADWPASLTVALSLPYSCQVTVKDPCPHCIVGGGPEASASVQPRATVSGTIPWSVVLAGSLHSLIIGRFTASADLQVTIHPSVSSPPPVPMFLWSNQQITYLFQDACDATGTICTDVTTSSGGDVGVVDLGAVADSTAAGSFWTTSLRFQATVPGGDGATSCNVAGITVVPANNTFTVDVPVASTAVRSVIAEAIRNQFRRAARIAVTGAP